MAKITLHALNTGSAAEFWTALANVFEHSPWIAEAGCSLRPFANFDQLHGALMKIVREAGGEKQTQLIREHPDLDLAELLSGTNTSTTRGSICATVSRCA